MFEYSQTWNYMFRSRRGRLYLTNGNLYSDNEWLLKRIYNNSLSEHKLLGNDTFERLYRNWGRLKQSKRSPYLLGFGIAAAVRLILYKITKRMMNWWSFRQKPSRVWEINVFSSSKWRATCVTHSLSDYLTESKRYKWTCKGRLFHLTSHTYHVDIFI